MSDNPPTTNNSGEEKSPRFQRLKVMIGPAIGIVIAAISFFVLWELLSQTSRHETLEALTRFSDTTLIAAVIFTIISYIGIAFYDVAAVRAIAPGKIPLKLAAVTSAAGYAVSNALGFSFLTGGALRYHIYANEGVSLSQIGKIVGSSWLSIWFALFFIIAIALIIDPQGVPWLSHFDPLLDEAIGILMLCLLGFFIWWLSRKPQAIKFGNFQFELPDSKGAILQVVAGLIDVIAAAATLYILMPEGAVHGFAVFTLVYTLAVVIGVISHSPGGLGAFEATLIAGLGLTASPEALAALIVYRLIYTVLPLLVVIVGMALWEGTRQRKRVTAHAALVARILEPLVPSVAAGLTFLGGVVLLISVVTPGTRWRLDMLSDHLPMIFIESSNLAASLIGVTLLIISRGLFRRLSSAWLVTEILLLIGALFCVTKGLDWEEAIILCIFAILMLAFRQSFYRRPLHGVFSLSWSWLASVIACVFAAVWLGFFVYRHVEYNSDLWWNFAWNANAPRFLRVCVVVLCLVLIITLNLIVHAPTRRKKSKNHDIPDIIPQIVAKSHNSDAALALLGDKQFLIDPEGRGFIMYNQSGGSLIAMGEPIGEEAIVNDLAWSFRKLADSHALRTVFYSVGTKHLPLYLDMGLSANKLGEVARVDLTNFSLEGPKRQPFRYADRKAEREGLIFDIIPASDVRQYLGVLRHVSDQWLANKAGAEKRFSVGYFDDEFLCRYDVAVMKKDEQIVAFANIWKSGDKHEITIDMMRYLPNISKVMMDALFARLFLYGKAEGFHWFNLGAAPLAGLSHNPLAARWHRIGSFIYRRGAELYHFDGLKSFKEKFDPVWTPHYLICPGGYRAAKALIDVTTLINGSPWEFFRK